MGSKREIVILEKGANQYGTKNYFPFCGHHNSFTDCMYYGQANF
jgi:hypothetical protein